MGHLTVNKGNRCNPKRGPSCFFYAVDVGGVVTESHWEFPFH